MGNGRYYYTNPYAAAWMADAFGMTLQDSRRSSVSFTEGRWRRDADGAKVSNKFFIRPKSLHILQPQRKDCVEIDGRYYRVTSYLAATLAEGFVDLHSLIDMVQPWQIIARNGIAFHWPDCAKAVVGA